MLTKTLRHVGMAADDLRKAQPGGEGFTLERFRKANERYVIAVANALRAGATPGQIRTLSDGADL